MKASASCPADDDAYGNENNYNLHLNCIALVLVSVCIVQYMAEMADIVKSKVFIICRVHCTCTCLACV